MTNLSESAGMALSHALFQFRSPALSEVLSMHLLPGSRRAIFPPERAEQCRLLQQPDVAFVLRLPLWSAKSLPSRRPGTNEWSQQRCVGCKLVFYQCFRKRFFRNVGRPMFS